MTQVQLPAHLQNRQVRSLTERAAEGMGSSLPPHISIQGNSFTFIDAAGNEYQPMLTFDAAIVDVSDVMCKRYYDKPFDPNASTYEPPPCWSANGIAPSREATMPQAALCAGCDKNERGSAVSRISGAAIKACRDERWIAIMHPLMPSMIFQMVITPGSFKNWKTYTETLRNFGMEMSLVITRFSFLPKTNGVLLFENVDWVDVPTADAIEAANREKKTDLIVGRNDQPRLSAQAQTGQEIAAKAQQMLTMPAANPNVVGTGQIAARQEVLAPTTQVQSAGPFVPAAGAPAATSQSTQQAMQFPSTGGRPGATPTISPSEQPAQRRRRTKAEMNAAGASQPALGGQPALGVQPAAGGFVPAAPQVPFPVAGAAPAMGTAPGTPGGHPQFGMAPGAPVNTEMEAMLKSMGFTRQPG